ncbi:tyrosine phosphatase family-domain-containing protein [Myxozyma melibiosi]|uniref:diphosphoinositol-polyphosphate diphosphatase n=1 Tax=Myxozyma melibiosi TaxID=54550 RepID=A0ABR1FFB0_9ASCO
MTTAAAFYNYQSTAEISTTSATTSSMTRRSTTADESMTAVAAAAATVTRGGGNEDKMMSDDFSNQKKKKRRNVLGCGVEEVEDADEEYEEEYDDIDVGVFECELPEEEVPAIPVPVAAPLTEALTKTVSAPGTVSGYAVPENFSMVAPGIYRSSFPQAENFEYLKKKNFKSILVLVPEPYPEHNKRFLKENNIQFFQVGLSQNKEPFANVSSEAITTALKIAINPANHPLLIHCNGGKHRTGCLVGCIRKLQDWSLTMIFDEYRRFAHPKVRPLDQQFIELYDEREVVLLGRVYKWLPIRWDKSMTHSRPSHSSGAKAGSGVAAGRDQRAPQASVASLHTPLVPKHHQSQYHSLHQHQSQPLLSYATSSRNYRVHSGEHNSAAFSNNAGTLLPAAAMNATTEPAQSSSSTSPPSPPEAGGEMSEKLLMSAVSVAPFA